MPPCHLDPGKPPAPSLLPFWSCGLERKVALHSDVSQSPWSILALDTNLVSPKPAPSHLSCPQPRWQGTQWAQQVLPFLSRKFQSLRLGRHASESRGWRAALGGLEQREFSPGDPEGTASPCQAIWRGKLPWDHRNQEKGLLLSPCTLTFASRVGTRKDIPGYLLCPFRPSLHEDSHICILPIFPPLKSLRQLISPRPLGCSATCRQLP